MGVTIALFLCAVALFAFAWWLDRRRRLYADTSTTPAAAVFIGHNEVKGRAWVPEPSISHMTQTPSVSWTYVLQEERQHTRTVTDTDGQGRQKTRTETYNEWHDIENYAADVGQFDVIDETGSVGVSLAGAIVVERSFGQRSFKKQSTRTFLSSRTGRYQESERGVAVGDVLFVAGGAHLHEETISPVFAAGEERLLISTRSEESHRKSLGIWAPLIAIAAVVVSAFASVQALDTSSPFAALPGVLLGAGLVALGLLIITFNRLKVVGQQALRSWSLIDVQLSRRHDLIPKLAAIAQAHAAHESELALYTSMIRSGVDVTGRSATAVEPDDVIAAYERGAEQTKWLTSVFAIAEDYPALTASESFQKLQGQLADTETRISSARTFYNDNVTMLADRSTTFPGMLVARFIKLPHLALFDARGFERTVPEVELPF